MARISQLFIYPLKSSRPLQVEQAGLSTLGGLEHDRSFAIYSADGSQCITLRNFGKLAQVVTEVEIEQQRLRLTAPGMNDLVVPLPVDPKVETYQAPIWQQFARVQLVAKAADVWLTEFLGPWKNQPLVLTRVAADHQRSMRGFADVAVGLQDRSPLLVTSHASLAAINAIAEQRGLQATDMRCFRPNLVLEEMDAPFAETQARTLWVGNDRIRIDLKASCVRCAVPTLNPDSGLREQDRGGAALQILAEQGHRDEEGVLFGMVGVADLAASGTPLQVGDAVELSP